MKRNKFSVILNTLLAIILIAIFGISFISGPIMMDATSATTYTKTINADNIVIRAQDGYIPNSTYDRIGLESPQDIVLDTIVEDGEEVEYAYILDKGTTSKPFLVMFKLTDIANETTAVTRISLTPLPYISSPTGLWMQTTTVNGVKRKEMYIADSGASYTETFNVNGIETKYTFTGLIYRVQFDLNTNQLLLNQYDIIHEPVEECPEIDASACAIDKAACSICAEGQYIMKTPAFGQTTEFKPVKVAVDTAGNIFIASTGTIAGMIELTYSGEFVSFFVVNTVKYNFLYQFIRKYGTEEQLNKIDYDNPESFYNVFIDNQDLVYSVTKNTTTVFDKYSTGGTSILENPVKFPSLQEKQLNLNDAYVTKDGLMFVAIDSGLIYVYAPDGQLIFFFGSTVKSSDTGVQSIVGFFQELTAIAVDKNNNIWTVDSSGAFLQTFSPTSYANSIYKAIISFNNHDYETSEEAWREVLTYDSLSVLANDGLGKAYYYSGDYQESLNYFRASKNRALYSNVFWELRNDYLQANLAVILIVLIVIILAIVIINYLFKNVKKLQAFKVKMSGIKENRVWKDFTVGFRLIKKPGDTFYELKVKRRGSFVVATIHYILAIIAIMLNTYSYALPFQYVTTNTLSGSTVFFATVAIMLAFVLCNYLVSAINNGEGTFMEIYKFTGYCMLPIIICLPLAVGVSYGLTLNEQVIISVLKVLGFGGTGILLVLGIIETHNYTFGQTVKNIILTIIFIVLLAIVIVVMVVMFDQIVSFLEVLWKEVKLRVGWY